MTAPASARSGSGFAGFRATLNQQDRRSVAGMYGFIAVLHVVGWGVLIAVVVPRHYDLGATGVYGLGGRGSGVHARAAARIRCRPPWTTPPAS